MEESNGPIRIAHVIGKLNAAGVEAVVNNYYRNIDHSKYQFDYYIDSDGECQPSQELIDMGARYFVIPPYQNLGQHIRQLTRLFKENQYKIVHTGMNTLAPISMFCAWCAGVPVRINHNHSTAGKGDTKRNLMKYTLRPFARCFATHYAACSRYAGEWLFGKKMVESGKVKIFNNAIDVNKYKFNSKVREEVRRELALDDKYVVGHVGRFVYQKNHEFLIDVFESVHQKNKNALLLLVGIGELQDRIKEKVKTLGLTDSVQFLGARNDVYRLYQAMDVFVLPSHYEGLPVVGVEAQAAGLPCIFSDQMTRETIVLDDAKMVSLTDDLSIWSNAILQAKTSNRSAGCKKIAEAGYDIAIEVKRLQRTYDEWLTDDKKE